MWRELPPIGRHRGSGGYRRYAWTGADADCRAWFRGQAGAPRAGLRARPQRQPVGLARRPAGAGDAVVTGSHLDSVPGRRRLRRARSASSPPSPRSTNSGARGAQFDRPLGHRQLRRRGGRPLRARLRRAPGSPPGSSPSSRRTRCATATASPCRGPWSTPGYDPDAIGPDPERLARIGAFVELHVEQGRALRPQRRPGRRRRPRSGRTAAGGSTSTARPTTRAPPGWPTAATRC